MNKIKLVVFGLAVVLLATGSVYAQPDRECRGGERGQREDVFKALNLTPEQQKKLDDNRKAQRDDVKNIFTAIKEKQLKLQDELKKPDINKAAVDSLANEIKSLQGQLVDHRINGILAVKGILTPEQFSKFQGMMEQNKEKRKQRIRRWGKERAGSRAVDSGIGD